MDLRGFDISSEDNQMMTPRSNISIDTNFSQTPGAKIESLRQPEVSTSVNLRKRVLAAINHEIPNAVPGHFLNIDDVRPYFKHYGFKNRQQLLEHFQIGIRRVRPNYRKPVNEPWAEHMLFDDLKPISFFGTSGGTTVYDEVIEHRPFHDVETLDKIEAYPWPQSTEDWNFNVVPEIIDSYQGKYATMIGAWNPVLCQVYDFFSMEKTLINLCLRQ